MLYSDRIEPPVPWRESNEPGSASWSVLVPVLPNRLPVGLMVFWQSVEGVRKGGKLDFKVTAYDREVFAFIQGRP